MNCVIRQGYVKSRKAQTEMTQTLACFDVDIAQNVDKNLLLVRQLNRKSGKSTCICLVGGVFYNGLTEQG